jgi:hypothetical protein
MSALRSALEEWVVEDIEHLHLDQLADDLVELETVSGLLEAERLRHHLKHWANRGNTDIVDGKLRCRFHHVLTHVLEDQGRDPPT